MRLCAVALIDGEHYPPVVFDALRQLGDRFEFRAALFLGGTEKIDVDNAEGGGVGVYGLPVIFDTDPRRGLSRIIDEYHPDVVVDLSDEPVLGYEQRFRLISEALARDVGYVGPDFRFSPASRERLCTSPSLSVIGTGKRVGKTAVSGHIARVLQEVFTGRDGGPGVVVVAMGRGGPAVPEVVDGAGGALAIRDLLAWSRRGRHAASDHFEDAVLSRVVTVGCRRCGGGLAGEPFTSNVADGVELANGLGPGLIILEGSGAAIPPVGADASVLIAGAGQPVECIVGYLGAYRLLISDALVLTMAEEPLASVRKVREIAERVQEVRPGLAVVPVVLRPRPAETVAGRRVAFFSTAPGAQEPLLRRYLEDRWGCKVEMVSTHLADRKALRADLERPEMSRVDTLLTEIKAAAIDVVAEAGQERGLPVVPVDNVPEEASAASEGSLAAMVDDLAALARQRFESRV